MYINKLRKHLKISLDDLGFFLGLSRYRVHQFETGKSMERGKTMDKLHQLFDLVRQSKKSDIENPWVNKKALAEEADQWVATKRNHAATYALELGYRLKEMKAEYESYITALDTMAFMLEDPGCTPELTQWINIMTPRLVAAVDKISPMEQAKLDFKRKEALGRSK